MSRLRFIVVVLCLIPFSSIFSRQQERTPQFVEPDTLLLFAPFDDNSGFGGRWKLAHDIPRYLSSYCRQRFQVGVVSPAAVAIFDSVEGISPDERTGVRTLDLYMKQFGVRYIVLGSVETFSVTRFIIAEQSLAGYEAFSAEVLFKFSLYDTAIRREGNGKLPLYEGDASGIIKDKRLGLTLLGRQTERTNQYFSLDELYFGGEQFNKTIIGEAMLKCAEDFAAKLEKAIPHLKTKSIILPSTLAIDSTAADGTVGLTRRVVRGEVILVDGDDVFLNVGDEERVHVGDLLGVFVEGDSIRDPKTNEVLGVGDVHVGEVQIIEVRAPHLSVATILKGKGVIKPRGKVRAVIVR